MIKTIHPIAGGLALITVLGFWVSTVWAELFGRTAMVVAVKTAIPWGFVVLIPALVVAAGSGFALSRHRRGRLIDAKRRRMPIIAANGILILVPAALFLAFKANTGELDMWFYGVQSLELLVGAVNVTLLLLNMRDGLRLAGG